MKRPVFPGRLSSIGRVGFLVSGSLSKKCSMAVVTQVSQRWLEILISEFQEAVLHVLKACKLIWHASRE